jgi:hypothetical protein
MRRFAGRPGTKGTPCIDRLHKRSSQRRLGFEPLEDRRLLDGGGMPRDLFVDRDAQGLHDGSSWQNAFQRLQDALATARSGDEIHVAQGIYTPAGPGGDRAATFQLVTGVAVRGCESFGKARKPSRPFGV